METTSYQTPATPEELRTDMQWAALLDQGYVALCQVSPDKRLDIESKYKELGYSVQCVDTAYLDMNPQTGRRLPGYITVFIKPVNSLPRGLQSWFNGKLRQQGSTVETADQHDS